MLLVCVKETTTKKNPNNNNNKKPHNWAGHKSTTLTPNTHLIPTYFRGSFGWLEEDIIRQWNHVHPFLPLFLISIILKSSLETRKKKYPIFSREYNFPFSKYYLFFLENGSLQGKRFFSIMGKKEHLF